MQVIKKNQVQEKIITIRNQKIIIDADVAELYGVETKRINEAVKNNPEKFPKGYLFKLNENEKNELVENFDRFEKLKHSSAPLKGFTEKGLYMLATILKSPKAVETTLAIIDTFAKVRELSRTVNEIQVLPENSPKQKTLIEHTCHFISYFIFSANARRMTLAGRIFSSNCAQKTVQFEIVLNNGASSSSNTGTHPLLKGNDGKQGLNKNRLRHSSIFLAEQLNELLN